MLEGITVLKTIEIMDIDPMKYIIFVAITFICMVSAHQFLEDIIGFGLSFLISIIIGVAFIIGFTVITSTSPNFMEKGTGRYQYKCIIDDNVSLTELTKNYEIIEQQNDIYIIEDRIE